MRIGNIDVISVQVQQGYILTGYTADNAEVKVPLLVASGKKEGPTFWINAGVHGEEVSGIFAIHKLFEIIDVENLRGTIVATPVCNPLAVRAIQKVTREDHMDMDMHFPGNPDGWLTEQMAYHFFKEVREHADFLVDLHPRRCGCRLILFINLLRMSRTTLISNQEHLRKYGICAELLRRFNYSNRWCLAIRMVRLIFNLY